MEAGPRSKKRAEGDLYDEDVTINAERYFKMMTEKVFDALVKKYPDAKRIEVQQDGWCSCSHTEAQGRHGAHDRQAQRLRRDALAAHRGVHSTPAVA